MTEAARGKVIPLRSLSDRTDDDLMVLAAAGRRDAFRALVERHGERVFRLCLRLTGWPAPLAEELAQDVWIGVWASRERYVPSGEFSAWLLTSVRHRCANARRDRARRGAVLTSDEAPDGRVPPAQLDAVLVREEQRRLQVALEALSPPLREAVALRFAEALPYDAIADAVGTNESTARSRVFHALNKLRALLAPSKDEIA